MPQKSTQKSGAGGTRKRKSSASFSVNWYKILGVRSNATPKSIKTAYIAKVKEFPPEQHPEEFQRIRAAYDVLRDPVKRAEYDFARKYGDSLDSILQAAEEALVQGKLEQAEELVGKALERAPDHINALITRSIIHLMKDQFEQFEQVWARLDQLTESDRDRVSSGMVKARILIDFDREEEALAVMRRLDERCRKLRKHYAYFYAQILDQNGRDEEAWKLMEETEAELVGEPPEDLLTFYIQWTKAMLYLQKKQFWDKVKHRFRSFLKSLIEPADKMMAVEALLDDAASFSERGAYKEAAIFVELAYFIDPRNPEVLTLRREIQEGSRLFEEIQRLHRDRSIFPAVSIKALELFTRRSGLDLLFPATLDMIPPNILDEIGGEKAAHGFFAAGIRKLRSKYPIVYKAFQDEWEEMYENSAPSTQLDR